MRPRVRHVPALAGFAALTVVWLWPLLRQPASVIPGAGPGDNLTFVWNTWWMHHALTSGQSPLWTTMLFAPWGTGLALHTHFALPALAGAALFPVFGGSAVAATNAVVVLNLFLNFVAAYALAFRITRRVSAACIGAFVFGCSPFIGAHLHGHFNLIAAWPLPLSALAALAVLEGRSKAGSVLAALVWGSLVYVDYYYTVYAVIVVALVAASRSVLVRVTDVRPQTWQRRVLVVLGSLLLLDVVVLLIIASTGGTRVRVGGLSVSMQGTDNPIAAAGLLAMTAAAVLVAPALRIRLERDALIADLRRLAAPLAMACLLSAPMFVSLAALWLNGDYASQKYFWRSAPPGVDLATLVLGNPAGLMTHGSTQRAYGALGVDIVEQSAWLGPAVIVLCAIAVMARRERRETGLWLITGAIFAIWALGPYVLAAGRQVWVILPATAVRFVPLVSNARIPSRAMIVVSLSAAMLAAIAWRHLLERDRRRLAVSLFVLLLADYLPARPPLFTVDRPRIYEALAVQPGGGVCELPLGVRDGFGETGRLDTRVLAYQTQHDRPLTGGFVARLSPRLLSRYETDPVLGPLLRLSGGARMGAEPPIERGAAGARLLGYGIRYVVVNQETAPPDLVTWVRSNLPLRPLAIDGARALYAIDAGNAESR